MRGILIVYFSGVALIFLRTYARVLVTTLAPERTGHADGALRTPEGNEPDPAYPQYFFDQALRDWMEISRLLLAALAISTRSAGERLGRMFSGRTKDPGRPDLQGGELALSRAIGTIVAVALAGVAVIVTALAAVVTLIHAALLLVAGSVVGLGALTMAVIDRAGQLVRRITIACPHPGCYAPIGLPEYECGCGRRHRRLRPGRLGVVRRTCVCGRRLPTLLRRGRAQLAAFCPHCHRPLPDRIGSERVTHVPVVGGPSAGKTMLLMSAVAVLEAQAHSAGFEVTFASATDRAEFARVRDALGQDHMLPRTIVRPPRAFGVYVGTDVARRLVYLYDAAGESARSSEAAQELEYLERAHGLLFVIDPFAVPGVVRELDEVGRAAMVASAPSPEDPDTTLTRLGNVMRAMSGHPASLPVAVVVTKCDALPSLSAQGGLPIGAHGDSVVRWLQGHGLGPLIRSLALDFDAVEYWAVSAKQALSDESGGRAAAAPVRWLLHRSGLELPEAAGVR